MFYPGWRAQVDGVPTPIYRANVSLRVIALPKGQHTVRFWYEPAPFFRGLWISLISLSRAPPVVRRRRLPPPCVDPRQNSRRAHCSPWRRSFPTGGSSPSASSTSPTTVSHPTSSTASCPGRVLVGQWLRAGQLPCGRASCARAFRSPARRPIPIGLALFALLPAAPRPRPARDRAAARRGARRLLVSRGASALIGPARCSPASPLPVPATSRAS